MLETFWKPKIKITFILKSGKEIVFRCKNFKITKDGNDLTSCTIVEGDGKMFYYRMDEIAAILQG